MHVRETQFCWKFYSSNVYVQRKVISLTKSLRDEAITNVYRNTKSESLGIADLGCSYGANTFLVIGEAIKAVEKFCQEQKQKSPEYKVYLNDLPGNDFNNVFRSFDAFKKDLTSELKNPMGPFYFFGAPGSFYDKLFPNKSLHFVHSSYSLHFLSKVCSYMFVFYLHLIILICEMQLKFVGW